MVDWMEAYAESDDLNRKYELLRDEAARLRRRRDEIQFFDRDEVAQTVSDLDAQVEGELIVFVANDFGRPVAYRPEGSGFELQAAVRRTILDGKYSTQSSLDELRQALLERHPEIHKAIIVEIDGASIRYHLPEGSNVPTNFLTVREMVGLVDYTTNSDQREDLSETY